MSLSAFDAGGLVNEPSLNAIFRGDFAQAAVPRDGPLLPALLQGYLDAFARACADFLPPNKVEMMSRECVTERVTTNGFGAEVSRYCVEYEDRPRNLFADPELLAVTKELDRAQSADAVRSAFQLLAGGNPIGSAMGMVATVKGATNDMASLVGRNSCGGPGLRRFSENLRRFALNLAPLRLAPQGGIPAPPPAPAPDHDLGRFLDDLVSDQSRSWLVNKYQRGSVSSVVVASRDAQGNPTRLEASYAFVGFSGPASGTLIVTFLEGTPNCIYFFDSPACRTPGRAIVSSYLAGGYARK